MFSNLGDLNCYFFFSDRFCLVHSPPSVTVGGMQVKFDNLAINVVYSLGEVVILNWA